MSARQAMVDDILTGRTSLGIELGSTRIKAVLVDSACQPLAVSTHAWESTYREARWTYPLEDVQEGVQAAYRGLVRRVEDEYGVHLGRVGSIGVSAMMHGYLVFDEDDALLTNFRTWRNTDTGPAARELSEALDVNIPLRWSIAHLYQAVLNGEAHVPRIAKMTTLAGYVHRLLSGEHVLGIGDASGMFPIDTSAKAYDSRRTARVEAIMRSHGVALDLSAVLPRVLVAGDDAGCLTPEGARVLDPSGRLVPGAPMCPPEGDAGTGMVATSSVAPRSGNVSAGTSIFAMVVLDRNLGTTHPELDLVTTPAGDPVAMVHCNNGAAELDAWARMFMEFSALAGQTVPADRVFEVLFHAALGAEADAGGVTAVSFLAGEPIAGVPDGRPMVVRTPAASLTLGNFVRAQIFSVFATLRLGIDVLRSEGVSINTMHAHGGIFTTPEVAQRFLAAAIRTPIVVGSSAPEGGAWGMAVLAAFSQRADGSQTLSSFLDEIFAGTQSVTSMPQAEDSIGYDQFLERFIATLPAVRAAAGTN